VLVLSRGPFLMGLCGMPECLVAAISWRKKANTAELRRRGSNERCSNRSAAMAPMFLWLHTSRINIRGGGTLFQAQANKMAAEADLGEFGRRQILRLDDALKMEGSEGVRIGQDWSRRAACCETPISGYFFGSCLIPIYFVHNTPITSFPVLKERKNTSTMDTTQQDMHHANATQGLFSLVGLLLIARAEGINSYQTKRRAMPNASTSPPHHLHLIHLISTSSQVHSFTSYTASQASPDYPASAAVSAFRSAAVPAAADS